MGRILQQIHNRSRREPQGQSEAQPELVYYQNEPQLFLLQTAFTIFNWKGRLKRILNFSDDLDKCWVFNPAVLANSLLQSINEIFCGLYIDRFAA